MEPIILASSSPRRKDLLEEAGFEVECHHSGVEELVSDVYRPQELAFENASRKWWEVAPSHHGRLVIAADTVVWRRGKFYHKPTSLEHAVEMLAELAGEAHEVMTITLLGWSGHNPIEIMDESFVTLHPLRREMLERYVRWIDPLDKAGGYAAQADGGVLVRSIIGSRTNVIGLPMEKVAPAVRFHLEKVPRPTSQR